MERVEESERGWMMLFLVSRPKLTGNKRTDRQAVSLVSVTRREPWRCRGYGVDVYWMDNVRALRGPMGWDLCSRSSFVCYDNPPNHQT